MKVKIIQSDDTVKLEEKANIAIEQLARDSFKVFDVKFTANNNWFSIVLMYHES